MRHRPVGLGVMGFQDALIQQNISYESQAAVEFADASMEAISYYAISASSELAKERESLRNLLWFIMGSGIFPLDSVALLKKQRGASYIDQDESSTFRLAIVEGKGL